MIDKVVCVCLDKRKELWPALEKQVNEIIGLPLNKFVVGKGEDPTLEYDFIDKPFSKDMWRYCRYGTRDTIASHANCFLSHKEIIKRAKEEGVRNILLLEDDAYLIESRWKDLGDSLEEFLESIDYNIFYAGWWLKTSAGDSEDQNETERGWAEEQKFAFKKVPSPPAVLHNICGFHGVIIHNSMFDFLIDASYGPMDSLVGTNIHCFEAYMSLPKLITVNSTFSYGENCYVERNKLI